MQPSLTWWLIAPYRISAIFKIIRAFVKIIRVLFKITRPQENLIQDYLIQDIHGKISRQEIAH
jgi:hypothetical protein